MSGPAKPLLPWPGAGDALRLVIEVIAALVLLFGVAQGGEPGGVPQIAVGDAVGIRGGVAEVTVRVNGPGFAFETAQLDILFDGDSLAVGPADCRKSARLPEHVLIVTDPTTQPEPPKRRVRFALLDLSEPIDQFPEGDLFTCSFHVAPDAVLGSLALTEEKLAVSGDGLNSLCDFSGPIPCEQRDGTVLVAEPTATGTPTDTGTPTATPTATVPTATATATPTASPVPSATPMPCAGDCDGDGVVIIGELIAGVRVALGASPPSECAASDVNGDGRVTVNELVAAVARALNGCGI